MINKHRPRSVLRIFFTTSVEVSTKGTERAVFFETSAVESPFKDTVTGQQWKDTFNKNTPTKKRVLFFVHIWSWTEVRTYPG